MSEFIQTNAFTWANLIGSKLSHGLATHGKPNLIGAIVQMFHLILEQLIHRKFFTKGPEFKSWSRRVFL